MQRLPTSDISKQRSKGQGYCEQKRKIILGSYLRCRLVDLYVKPKPKMNPGLFHI